MSLGFKGDSPDLAAVREGLEKALAALAEAAGQLALRPRDLKSALPDL